MDHELKFGGVSVGSLEAAVKANSASYELSADQFFLWGSESATAAAAPATGTAIRSNKQGSPQPARAQQAAAAADTGTKSFFSLAAGAAQAAMTVLYEHGGGSSGSPINRSTASRPTASRSEGKHGDGGKWCRVSKRCGGFAPNNSPLVSRFECSRVHTLLVATTCATSPLSRRSFACGPVPTVVQRSPARSFTVGFDRCRHDDESRRSDAVAGFSAGGHHGHGRFLSRGPTRTETESNRTAPAAATTGEGSRVGMSFAKP